MPRRVLPLLLAFLVPAVVETLAAAQARVSRGSPVSVRTRANWNMVFPSRGHSLVISGM